MTIESEAFDLWSLRHFEELVTVLRVIVLTC